MRRLARQRVSRYHIDQSFKRRILRLLFSLIEEESQRSFMQQLYFRCRARMYAAVFSVMGHHQDNEDIVNDTLLKLIEIIPLLMGLSRFALQSSISSLVQGGQPSTCCAGASAASGF